MTESELRNKVVTIMKGWLGCKESDGSHRKIIDIYNAHKPLARGYTVQYNDAWCATCVSAAFIQAGLTDIAPTECSCKQMITLYQKLGRWKEDDAYVPAVGDVMMYDWDDSGVGDCTGDPDHVGIVTAVSGSNITIIEGNKSDAVAYRSMKVNGKYIRGYCLPNYASKATSSATASTTSTTSKTSSSVDAAKSVDKSIAGTYKTTAALNLRSGAGTSKAVLVVIPKGATVTNYGYYTAVGSTKWLFVQYAASGKTYTGFASGQYLKKA